MTSTSISPGVRRARSTRPPAARPTQFSGRPRGSAADCLVGESRFSRGASTVSSHLMAALIVLTFAFGCAVVITWFLSFSNAPLG